MRTAKRHVMHLVLAAMLAALTIVAQRSARNDDDEAAASIDRKTLVKIRDASLKVSDELVERSRRTLSRLKSRTRPDDEDLREMRRLEAQIAYCEVFDRKFETRRELERLQEKIAKQKETKAEDMERLLELDESYRQSVQAMSDQRAAYQQARFNKPLTDPMEFVLRKLYPPGEDDEDDDDEEEERS